MYCCTSSASLSCSLQALPEEHLEAAYENGFVDYRALLCQQGGQCLASGVHCKHHNSHSIGICYIGGLDNGGTTPKDTRTEAQKATLRKLIEQLHQRYPKALIVGHHDLNPQKACPCFHVTAEYIDLQP